MNFIEQIKLHEKELTPRELEVYRIVLNDPIGVSGSTTSQIVSRYHVSQSSISRFCQKIGYNNYSDFRMALYLSISTNQFQRGNTTEIHDMVYYMCELTKAVKHTLSDDLLDSLAHRVLNAKTVYTAGTAYSSIPAQLLAFQLMLSSHAAYCIPSGAELEMLHVTTSEDIVFLFSTSNPTHQDFLTTIKEISPDKRPYTVLVTAAAKHPLRNLVNEVIVLPTWSTMHYPIAVDYSFSTNIFCNIFSSYLMNATSN